MESYVLTSGQLVLAKLEIDLDEVPLEYLADYAAVEYYLTVEDYPSPDATNLEKVHNYLEAFHHLCNAADWKRAKEILGIKLNTPTLDTLHIQLHNWGYHVEQSELYSQLLGKLDSTWDAIYLKGLGTASYAVGQYHQAIKFYHQYLTVAQQEGNQKEEGNALFNLGCTYELLGDYNQAIVFYQNSLTIAQALGDRWEEVMVLESLGDAYLDLEQYERAIEFHQQSLAIKEAIGDCRGVGVALRNLGNAFLALENYHQALKFYQQSLSLAQKFNDKEIEATVLSGLGDIYFSLEEYERSIELHKRSLALQREIGNLHGELAALNNLGNIYYCLSDYEKALDFYKLHLANSQSMKILQEEGEAMCNLGATLIQIERNAEGLESLQKAREIFQMIGARYYEAITVKNLAVVYQMLDNRFVALDYCEQALAIATQLNIPLAKECRNLKKELLTHTLS